MGINKDKEKIIFSGHFFDTTTQIPFPTVLYMLLGMNAFGCGSIAAQFHGTMNISLKCGDSMGLATILAHTHTHKCVYLKYLIGNMPKKNPIW